jgi:hypothetical protein
MERRCQFDQKLHQEHMMENRSLRLSYEKLRILSVGEPFLNIHVHRYMAVAKGARLGCFSTIEMACREVDERATAYRDTWWSGTPVARGTSYVVDLVAGQTYERVRQGVRSESEPTLA